MLRMEKVYAAQGMPLPNAYGYWVFISYHRCKSKSIGIELPSKHSGFYFSVLGKLCNEVRGLEPKSLCLLIILVPVLGSPPILFEHFQKTLQ